MNMTRDVKINRAAEERKSKGAEVNFMGGVSYALNPMDTLKIVTASSIFGEPQYYVDGGAYEKTINRGFVYFVDKYFAAYLLGEFNSFKGKNTVEIMEDAIDKALAYNFEEVLKWAVTLRKEYYMRLNPQVIMVRAAMHEGRKAYTEANEGKFTEYNMQVMSRADDVISQLTYYMYKTGGKKNIPGILKKSWAKKINSLSRYELYKYRNHGIGLINTIRICHANNADIDELMSTGTLVMPEESATWEALRASGESWSEIVKTIKMNHMALLRNLRGIFAEIEDYDVRKDLLTRLENGVEKGKQFPFRYFSAYRAVASSDVVNKSQILDSLEGCMDISCTNLPKLEGNNAFLSDNSGSAWGSFTSEYGTVNVAEINNLSCIIGAVNSDVGAVFSFGDRLRKHEISKRQGVLQQTMEISKSRGNDVGVSTECGIWLFFDAAIKNKVKYDNIFIYSDMQAGHGGLYGTKTEQKRYAEEGYALGNYIDVAKLVDTYRKQVNPKVNVFSVQTAGYTNSVIPENGYRTAILTGWTGKELVYAKMMNDFWDAKDSENRG